MAQKRVIVVDMVFMVALLVLLVGSLLLNLDRFLFRLPFVTLLLFYYIGKWARSYEIKLQNRRNTSPNDSQ